MKALDDFLPEFDFSERHRLAIKAPPERIDEALRTVSIADIPIARALWFVRRLGRPYGDTKRPFVGGELRGVVLEDDFLAYAQPDTYKAVIDFRIGPSLLSTETPVHVADPAARRKFRRYWFVIRPFSGLIRILLLRAARKKAEAPA